MSCCIWCFGFGVDKYGFYVFVMVYGVSVRCFRGLCWLLLCLASTGVLVCGFRCFELLIGACDCCGLLPLCLVGWY